MFLIYDIFTLVIFMGIDRKSNARISIKHDKGHGDKMPTVENVNYEMTNYLRDIEEYIEAYKQLPKDEAKKRARENLMDTGIIDEQGNLTGFYKNS